MVEGVLFNIAEEVLKKLGSKALHEIASAWGFKGDLKKLTNTMTMIKCVLQDAEERQLDSPSIRCWLQRLRSVVLAADDLFDEFSTVASQKELKEGNKLINEVKIFFSRNNQVSHAFTISQKIKKIREDLDEINKNGREFAFMLHPCEQGSGLVRRQQRDETHSFVIAEEVIGRDEDKKVLLDILLASSSQQQPLSVIPIVGIGGLGKTTLAQFIYNDVKVEQHFELRLWVCVSDIFDVKEITKKMLMSATDSESQSLDMDQLQRRLRKAIGGKIYLMVLDDVWSENREKWLELSTLLKAGKEGSKILVTTRSWKVAENMGTVPPYELRGLSEDKSWTLFQQMAFDNGEDQKKPELVKLGKEIVKRCSNVPLAIRVLGSLLRCKDESTWRSFEHKNLLQMPDKTIKSILELSYNHLWSPLKNCFAYCALFPKDYELSKETLIDLWMAEGFIIPKDSRESPQEIGEEYFLTLLQRCFFQDITKDSWGNIVSWKMHDFMHDLAQEVAGVESSLALSTDMKLDNNIRHLSFGYSLSSTQEIPKSALRLKLLRTFLLPTQRRDGSSFSESICRKIISTSIYLRVLDLHNLGVKDLPSSISKLIHLRYLNLSSTPIEELPESITQLQNLQTLDLNTCIKLRRLPTDIGRLTNLMSLDLCGCSSLTHMPPQLGVLTSLHKLTTLMVGSRKQTPSRCKTDTAQLRDLKNLDKLRGVLQIEICGELNNPAFESKEAELSRKHGLVEFCIEGDWKADKVRGIKHDESVLEGLKPHPNLKKLQIYWCRFQRVPSWAVMDNLHTSLPNLVEISLQWCGNCQQLPTFSQLPFLKHLSLVDLKRVEYMESSLRWLPPSSEGTLFFPSLEKLVLMYMDNLKQWWKEIATVCTDDQNYLSLPIPGQEYLLGKSFSNLSKLHIENCPNLTSMPPCPNVEDLRQVKVNNTLQVLKRAAGSATSQSKLKSLSIDSVRDLISLPKGFSSLYICDDKLQSTRKVEGVFKSLSSLRSLEFHSCHKLESIARGLEHLTALENLVFSSCKELDLSPQEEMESEDGHMPWKAFKGLRSLRFSLIEKLSALPSGLQHLTNLRSLELNYDRSLMAIPEWISCFTSLEIMVLYCCTSLTSLPEGFSKLTNLQELRIVGCPGLTKRCQGPTGEDCPKIRHIPFITFA